MLGSSPRSIIEALLSAADVQIGGEREWDIQVHDERFFKRLLRGGTRALGESYVDGDWDCDRLDILFDRLIRARLEHAIVPVSYRIGTLLSRLFNPQTPSRAHRVGRFHYDLGNDMYGVMLDRHMIYSCGYWEEADSLEEAQLAKMDLVCRKLRVQPGMRVLDVGCGWGGMARFMASNYGAEVVGITISEEQASYAVASGEGLPVEIRVQDYRALDERFDRILSIGMFEHVGYKNYGTFMKVMRRCLARNGLLLLHTIGNNISLTRSDPWISRYIFPNSMAPSAKQLAVSFEGRFVLEDWHGFGADYDRTLMAWHSNLAAGWDRLKSGYDERFYRIWTYYLLSCAGAFRARSLQVWQLVLSPEGVPGGYRAPQRGLRTDTKERSAFHPRRSSRNSDAGPPLVTSS
jgi:cyclopropane-fatty-acyl-phospholipid synthase